MTKLNFERQNERNRIKKYGIVSLDSAVDNKNYIKRHQKELDKVYGKYKSALQWIFTDSKIDIMEIKKEIHDKMSIVKRKLNWDNEQLFKFIMSRFINSNQNLFHNKDKYKHITIMINYTKKVLDGLVE